MYFNRESLICKIHGLHSISMVLHQEPWYIIIMDNVFDTTNRIHERYDLKGSWVNRRVGKAHDEDPSILGMDLDWKEKQRKLKIAPEMKRKLLNQLDLDSKFFLSVNIIDYRYWIPMSLTVISILLGYHFVERQSQLPDVESGTLTKHEERRQSLHLSLTNHKQT